MGKRLPAAADEGLERRRERLGLVAQGEADPHLAPVDAQDPAMRWDHRQETVSGER